jgi:exonuclease VII small subunit
MVAASLFAGGNPEVGLPKVDRLIKERNYNLAILELTNYMEEHPEDFDGAQARIRKIIRMREEYNDTAGALVNVLVDEPTNDEKKLTMIQSLETMEKNPNQSTQDFIAETKEAAQFTYYRAKFDEIMRDGNALIDQRRFVDAARKFTEGYGFYKAEFDEENANTPLLAKVNETLAGVTGGIAGIESLQAGLEASLASYEAAIAAGETETAERALAQAQGQLAQFVKARNALAERGWYFEDRFAEIQKKSRELTENSFLPFAYRFTLGRKTSGRFEGVLGAIDAQWNDSLDRVEKATGRRIRGLWLDTYQAISSTNTLPPDSGLPEAGQLARLGQRAVGIGGPISYRPDSFGKRDVAARATDFAQVERTIRGLEETERLYRAYRKVRDEVASYAPTAAEPAALRNAGSPVLASYAAFAKRLEDILKAVPRPATTSAPADSGSATVPAGDPNAPVPSSVYMAELSDYQKKLLADILAEETALYRASAAYQASSAEGMVADATSALSEARSLIDGVPSPQTGLTLYYPEEAAKKLTNLKALVAKDRASIVASSASIARLPATIRADPDVQSARASLDATVAALDRAVSEANAELSRANARVLQASLARQEADLRYSQSQSALKRGEFQAARDNLARSRAKMNEALALQESPTLREESDRKLERLGADIVRIENDAVVREVRSLIVKGKNQYYIGNFDQAEQVLLQAKARWAVTNVEPNLEVANWLEIINTALSMKTGRTIPVSAPLYPQMSQILSMARQLYAQGKALMAAGKRPEAIEVLASAKERLQQLQLVYPLNQDAGELTLRIDQLIDADAFKAFFRQKVEYIRENYRTQQQTAYSDLLDLYQIDPDYPGLKRLIDEVEIFLKIKIPPPNPKDIARSSELTREARRIYDSNNRSMFPAAVIQLDEAIKLNPENQQAINLKDRIQSSSGGQQVAVLSAKAEAQYMQAVAELQKGNKITAAAIVEQLLQDPKNRNSSKIQELKKRIDSQL